MAVGPFYPMSHCADTGIFSVLHSFIWLDSSLNEIYLCLLICSCPSFPFSCCFLPRSGRRSSPSPPPSEEKDHLETWAPVIDSEGPSLEGPVLPPSSSPSCCDIARPDEGLSVSQPVRRAVGGDHTVPLDPGHLDTVWGK